MVCNNDSSYKILNFCKHGKKGRYEYYCGECFMQHFGNESCKHSHKCNDAFVINEFIWINAYECASHLKQVFPGPLTQIDTNECPSGIHLPAADENSFEDSIESEETSEIPPYSFNKISKNEIDSKEKNRNSQNTQNSKYVRLDMYFYIKKSGKKLYISRQGYDWKLTTKPQKVTAGIKKGTHEVRLFISKFHFSIDENAITIIGYNSSKNLGEIPKFEICGENIKYRDKFITYKNDELTIGDAKGYAIFWDEF